jgi:DNA-binding transcriptional regulator YiaG
MSTAVADETVPYVMNLPENRTVFVRIPSEYVEYREGEMYFLPEGVALLDHIRALAMKTPARPTPGYVKAVRDALGLTQAQFARKLGRSVIAVKKWEGGTLKPGEDARLRIQKLVDRAGRRGVLVGG